MKEKTLLFGPGKSLVGVITEPAAGKRIAGSPAVLLLNSGILHRVGPNRSYVKIARALAEAGLTAMRFDFSGLGDSGPREGSTPFVAAVVEEARQCMDLLESTRGLDSFVLGGMCSGADNSLRVAYQDPRVVGAALIEAYTVPTRGQLLHSYKHKLLDPRSWWRLVRGRSELWSLLSKQKEAPAEAPPPNQQSLVPSREELLTQLRGLRERGTALCLIYAAGSPAHFNYEALLRAELRSSPQARVEVLSGTDHVFTPLAVQRRLVEILREWALALVDSRVPVTSSPA